MDGRYPSWGAETDPEYSTDGTAEYCKSLDKVDYYKLFADQNTKRTTADQIAKKHDCEFLLVLDADDYIDKTTDWNKFHECMNGDMYDWNLLHNHKNHQIYNVLFQMDPQRQQWIGRIFYKPYELIHISHWKVTRGIGGQVIDYPRPKTFKIPGLVMTSDDMTRPRSRLAIDTEYQWELFKKEEAFPKSYFDDPRNKKRFQQEIINEYFVWKRYYKAKKLKVIGDEDEEEEEPQPKDEYVR